MFASPPICDFGWSGPDFDLCGVDGSRWAHTSHGPREQIASIGCSIKWKDA